MKTHATSFWGTPFALAVCSLLTAGCHYASPRSSQVVADSISGFSGKQGANGWSYGYWDYTADTDKNYPGLPDAYAVGATKFTVIIRAAPASP